VATTDNTSYEEGLDGFMGFLKSSYRTGMDAAEEMQQAAIGVPLAMLEAIGVPAEQTQVLREKNRALVHGLIGSIESMAGQFAGAGKKQVELAVQAIHQATQDEEKDS
jgi:hypothetical protein